MEQKEAKLFRPAHKLAGTNMLYEGVQHAIFYFYKNLSPAGCPKLRAVGGRPGQRLGLEQFAALAQKLQ